MMKTIDNIEPPQAQEQQELLELAKRANALARNGLVYNKEGYDAERYAELYDLSNRMLSLLSGLTGREVSLALPPEDDYVTPRVDVRAVVFDAAGRLLMVREVADGRWSLPGGWADVGFSPTEVAVKEVREETGLEVRPGRLLAIHDKRLHPHPPALHYVYKVFIRCALVGGAFNDTFDISGKGFFGRDAIPELSLERVTPEQIATLFDYFDHPDKAAETD